MMSNSTIPCEKCGGLLEVFRSGRSQGVRCTQCDWSVVTTYTAPIDLDENIYEILIESGDFTNEQQIKIISKITNNNFLNSRKILKEKSFSIFKGNAKSVKEIRDNLIAVGLNIKIQPQFPW